MPVTHPGRHVTVAVAKHWFALLIFLCLSLLSSLSRSQEEEPAPEPYIPQSQFEQPQGESSLDSQIRTCNEALGYVGCDQLWHGGRGGGGAPGIWGALAISRSSLTYGYSYDYPSKESAITGAVN